MASTAPSRARSSAPRKPAARKPPARKSPAKRPAARRPAQRPQHRGPGPVSKLLRAFGLLVAGIFRGLSHAIGGITRATTGGAKDLDPAHRRDGLGLLLLAGALVAAGGAWWHAGSAGNAVADLLEGLAGKGALLLPLVLVLAAFKVLRHPESPGGRGRIYIGWAALSLGALGVLHVVKGRPADRHDAGGVLGLILGDPLAAAIPPWLAVPVLLLLAVFGLLVVTATPVHQIPERLKLLRDRLLLRKPAETPEEEGPQLEPLAPLQRNRPRRRQGIAVQDAPPDLDPIVADK